MINTYKAKYRQPGQIFWRTLRRVRGDGIGEGFRFFVLEDDTMIYVSIDAEVRFPPERATSIERTMSKEAGQPVQRA
jgi:hypothetical protein